MTSLTFNLGETEHSLRGRDVKLQTLARLHITLPLGCKHYKSLHEIAKAGFWITRGNDLKLRVRTDHSACAGLDLGPLTVEDAISRSISEAKCWLQLSLRTIRVELPSTQRSLRHSSNLTFAVTAIESLTSEGRKSQLRAAAKVHDIKPPSGVLTGFIDCIEFNFKFQPLLLIDPISRISGSSYIQSLNEFSPRRSNWLFQRNGELVCNAVGDIFWNSLRSEDGRDMNTEILFESSDLETQEHQSQPTPPPTSAESRAINSTASAAIPSPTLHPNLSALLVLIDMSLRHTISSTPCKFSNANRSFRHPDINTASATCLAEVVPAVFRPGYMQAISQRGPLISRMASSLSKICLRSHSQNLLCHSFTGKDLHIQLWTLLQKRSWPTTELEPLGQKELAIFSRPNGDEGTTLFESERDCNDAIGGLVKGTDADGDEDMLDDQFPKPVRVLSVPLFEDDDLFSSSGSTPLLSQSTMDEMMLEDVGEAEEMLLDDCDKYPSGQSLIPTSPCSDEEERAEKASRVQDMEEDGDFGMLF